MEGITHSGLGKIRGFYSVLATGLFVCFTLFAVQTSAVAQELLTPGLPGKNVNIIGPSPKPGFIPDFALRQQNEPTCSIRPENPAFILCAFNDYRATDLPQLAGDSWIGMAWSGDFGLTWYSRLANGYRGDNPALALGLDFAADANVVHAPGNSPGIAFLNYIAANRDLDNGVLALQRLAVMPQEDVEYYVPEKRIFKIDLTNSGRFSDRPTMIAIADPENQQTTQTFTMELEDGRTVTRSVPSGMLVFGYAIFTGSNGSKIYITRCFNWGENCEKPVKISEEQQRVQGVSLTNIGNRLVTFRIF